tara:strand:- start:1553 stop:2011 length:459 start_codon:yes stop_codon:yes gene_type:complete
MSRDLNLFKTFEDDPKDRKRRFLMGLNVILGREFQEIDDTKSPIKEAMNISVLEFRKRLVENYCLEFTPDNLNELIEGYVTTGEFTEQYCPVIYGDRGDVDLNNLMASSTVDFKGKPAIDFSKMDNAPKYGMNGMQWCDVATGPCSCGAWHQ